MNLKSLFKLNFFILFLGLFAQTSQAAIECQKDNEDLRSMPLGMVEFARVDGSKLLFKYEWQIIIKRDLPVFSMFVLKRSLNCRSYFYLKA